MKIIYMHVLVHLCAHVHAQGRKEAGKEREKEGRKRKKGRNKGKRKEQRDAPKLSHADGHVQARRACCASVSLPPLGRTFSCCKQERRRRKGGIAQENAEVSSPLCVVGGAAL